MYLNAYPVAVLKTCLLYTSFSKKDYLKVFFETEHENVEREERRYLLPNIYNNNDYNVCLLYTSIKGISWITLCLSFLFAGGQFFLLGEGRDKVCLLYTSRCV